MADPEVIFFLQFGEEDFDRVWDSLIEEYLAAGGQEVMEQRAALWGKMRGK